MVKNKGGIFVRAQELSARHYTPFLYDPATLHHRVRSYEGFLKQSCPPPAPSRDFQVQYSTSRRFDIYRMVGRSTLRKCVRFCLICGAFAVMISWWSRNCDIISAKLNSDFFISESWMANLQAASEVQEILLPLASFILALYINMKLGWFNQTISLCWSTQGKISDLALVLASVASPPMDAGVLAAKFRIYRYLNLMHFFTFQNLAVQYNHDTLDDLVRCGFIKHDEQELLAASTNQKDTVLVWVGAVFRELVAAGRIPSEILPRVLEILRELRGHSTTLGKELRRMAPISYAQLMQLMIDGLMVLTPPALSYALESDREGLSVYLWPAVGSMTLALFYQGCMRLVTTLEYPLGADLDDINCDWLLMSVEASLWAFLTDSMPKQLCEKHPIGTEVPTTSRSESHVGQGKQSEEPIGATSPQDSYATGMLEAALSETV